MATTQPSSLTTPYRSSMTARALACSGSSPSSSLTAGRNAFSSCGLPATCWPQQTRWRLGRPGCRTTTFITL
eukprot:6087229-Prymnesium_polylepis.1